MVSIRRIKVNEYTPIRSLLNIAVTEYATYHDQYIKIMVRDAISLSHDKTYRVVANTRMYRYSSYLSKHSVEVIRQMNPDRLSLSDYKTLFEIFSRI